MKVRDLMTTDVESCQPDTSLTDAAMAMWRRDCGVVPVVDAATGKALGIVTDRDICIATATRHETPEKIAVSQVMRDELYTCRPDEDVRDALETMQQHKVRRLPVIDAKEKLVGIVSLNDIVRRAEPVGSRDRTGVSSEEVLSVFKSICAPRALAGAARADRKSTRLNSSHRL